MKKKCWALLSSILISMSIPGVAFCQLPAKKIFSTPGSTSPFSTSVMVGKTLYISGMGDHLPGGGHPEGIAESTRQTLENIRTALKEAGMDMVNVVKCWVYMEDLDKFGEMNTVYATFFPKDPPARTTLGVGKIPGDSPLEITCIAYSDLSEKTVIGTPPPGYPFSPGILVGNTLYLSGKADQLPSGEHPSTVEEQVRQTMRNIEGELKKAGLDFRHVVLSRVYLDNYDNLGIMNKVYSEFFAYGNTPAREFIFVNQVPAGSHVEITCIATTDLSNRKVVRPQSMRYGPEEMSPTASPGVWAGNILYLSAQTGFIPYEGITTVDLEKQFGQAMQNQQDVLKEAGLDFKDVVSANVYLRNLNDFDQFNPLYRSYFAVNPGVRTTIQPNSGYEKNNIRIKCSFIAAKTKQ